MGMNGPQEQAYRSIATSEVFRATTERGEAAGIKQLPADLVRTFRAAYSASMSSTRF